MSLLFAVAQHVVIDATPVPVNIVSQDSLEVLAVRIAVAALVVAVITLTAVGYQIYLGRQELDAVKRDLSNNERMINDALRRAEIHVTAVKTANSHGRTNATLTFSARNTGNRQANDMLIEVLIPRNALVAGSFHANLRDVGSVTYFATMERLPNPLYPNGETGNAWAREFAVQDFMKPIAMLWRAYDVNGRYPTDDYGKVSI